MQAVSQNIVGWPLLFPLNSRINPNKNQIHKKVKLTVAKQIWDRNNIVSYPTIAQGFYQRKVIWTRIQVRQKRSF